MSEFKQKYDSAQPLVAALFRAPFATRGKARKGAVPLLSNVHEENHSTPCSLRARRTDSRVAELLPDLAIGRALAFHLDAPEPCNQPHSNLAVSRTPTLQSAALQPCNQPHSNLAISRTPTLQSAALQPCNQPHSNLAISRTPTLQSAALQPCNQPPPPSPLIFFGTNSRWGFQETITDDAVFQSAPTCRRSRWGKV